MSMNLHLLFESVTACKVSNKSEQNLPDINLYLALYSSFEIWWQMQKCSETGAAKAMHSTLSSRHCLMAAEGVMVALEQMRIGCCHNVIIGNLVIMRTNRLERQKFCTWGLRLVAWGSNGKLLFWQNHWNQNFPFYCSSTLPLLVMFSRGVFFLNSFYRNSKIRFWSRGYALCKSFKQKNKTYW